MNRRLLLATLAALALALPKANCQENIPTYDLVVYGGTSAGVIAAVQAKRMGKSTIIVGPDKHLGGLTAGGLGFTDTGDKSVIGGLSREFYQRVYNHYDRDDAWVWQDKAAYGNKGQGTTAIDGDARTMWIFEPHVAEEIFEDFVDEYDIPVWRDEWLDRSSGVEMVDGRIRSLTFLSGKRVQGRMFMDATYEGDLMASAGVQYHVGRESKDAYGEEWNGVQTGVLHHRHHFGAVDKKISPYVRPDDPSSGLLPRISVAPPGEYGAGDKRIQAYCFRMCLTNHDPNRIPFAKPENYDPSQYELLLRIFDAGWRETFQKFDPIPNRKTDTNNHGPFSTDNIGYNYDYPEGSYERRQQIIAEHETYQKGLMYFIANDPRVPEDVRKRMAQWGLAKDEFVDNGGWPHQIYVREARRMMGQFVMTENELLKRRPTPNPVGMGSYGMDSHNVQRYITPDGYVQNEGDIGVSTRGPYSIALGSLLPKKEQAENLVVSVCVSSSHIAFGSIRMEPVFMILGQSGATVACMAIDQDAAVQDVAYADIRKRLIEDKQILDQETLLSTLPEFKDFDGYLIDDLQAKKSGAWATSQATSGFIGLGYLHDNNDNTNPLTLTYEATIEAPGSYELLVSYTPHENRATNAFFKVEGKGFSAEYEVNQRVQGNSEHGFHSLTTMSLDKNSVVRVHLSNQNANGYVIGDAVWIRPSNP